MTIALTVICLALVGVVVYALRQNAEKERDWARERQLLITKIQHPELIHLPESREPDGPEDQALRTAEKDEMDLVGTVVNDGRTD